MRPRPYISYTQMMLVEKSPERYLDYYIRGRKKFSNKFMDLGKKVATSLETEEDTGDAMTDMIVSKLPKYDIMDQEIHLKIKAGKEVVPVLIKPDTVKKDHSAFIEYKTGQKGTWDRGKVDRDDQITFYATGLYTLTQKIPEMKLIQAVTEVDGGKVELTGEIIGYKTTRKYHDILIMKGRIYNAWKKIEKITEEELI